jgi:hypothetical protein
MKLAIEPDWQSVEGTRISAVVRGDGIDEAHYDGQHYNAPALANWRDIL